MKKLRVVVILKDRYRIVTRWFKYSEELYKRQLELILHADKFFRLDTYVDYKIQYRFIPVEDIKEICLEIDIEEEQKELEKYISETDSI
jgi:hypothetical protein